MRIIKNKLSLKNSPAKQFKVFQLLKQIYRGEYNPPSPFQTITKFIKVMIASCRKFIEDDCLTKASSIAYTIIISLIPTLTVILTFYSMFAGVEAKKEDFFNKISLFMLDHNIKINIDPILSAISGLIDNAGKIGGIGAVIMIFSATAMLRSLEKSLNHIWKVKKNRPFFLKIILYWSTLTLGPLLVIAATTVASKISQNLSSPNYNSITLSEENKTWLVGNKGSIKFTEKSKNKFSSLDLNRINFDNQKIYSYHRKKQKFTKEDQVQALEKNNFSKLEFSDLTFKGPRGWIISQEGFILTTNNNGLNWDIKKWDSFHLNDIEMINQKQGFIVADNGILLTTDNAGLSWTLKEWPGFTANLKSISFYKEIGIITASQGTLMISKNHGRTWKIQPLNIAHPQIKRINLNRSHLLDKKNIWVTGDEGMILFSPDQGKTWQQKKFKNSNYYSLFFYNQKKGLIGGKKGILLLTKDGGENWEQHKLPTNCINFLLASKDKIWAIGHEGMRMFSKDKGKTWQGQKGEGSINFIINFLTPFIFIWILFLLIYISLPNLKVPIKFAAIGATFTGATWVIFILAFNNYIKSFAEGTLAVYGALASIPLFLLLLYFSSLIILLGAEIAYTLMNPETYRDLKKRIINKNNISIYEGIFLLQQVYAKFEKGLGSSSLKELCQKSSISKEKIKFFLQLFLQEKLIIEPEEDFFAPANNSSNLKIKKIIALLYDINFKIPASAKEDFLKSYLENIFQEINRNYEKALGNLTLKDII